MRTVLYFLALFSFLTFNPSQVLAQAPGKHPKGHHHGAKPHPHPHPHRFHRNKVLVVKKRRGRVIHVLPAGHVHYVHKKNNYYFHDGFFYRPAGKTYVLVPSPFGLRVKTLPANHHKILIASKPHFYYRGTYYLASGNEYEVVEPTVGAVVPDLPEENVELVTIDGKQYHEYDGFLYESSAKGYELVGKLEG